MKKSRVKVLIESLMVTFLTAVVFIGWQVVNGYLLTKAYVPDIVNSYASVDNLQNKVAFGTRSNVSGLFIAAVCLFVGSVYYVTRVVLIAKRTK
ncbi:hypothetical protein [Paenibacillus prosopidis]|uniref:Uncharacterized protein n=1 Tax=Paenibacillus prosopidis TaxID=630520 RepID=A0A368VKX1_9BACL|nr:hypothetical protein [Paenibacillus prosopidis]RCW42134.1 hypothetical protein DFP97_119115 [Paenibacillus prosopidis]